MKFVSLLFAAALTAHATAASPCHRHPYCPMPGRSALSAPSPPSVPALDDLAAALADKAHRHGAIARRINAASSGNRLYGSAIIYQ